MQNGSLTGLTFFWNHILIDIFTKDYPESTKIHQCAGTHWHTPDIKILSKPHVN